MTDRYRQQGNDGLRPGGEPFGELCGKIALLVADDAFALTHLQPVLAVLKEAAHTVVVITRSSGRLDEIEALGVRVIDFDYLQSLGHPAREAACAWTLARILEAEDPDVVHLVGAQPTLLAGLALKLVPATQVVVHLPNLALLEPAAGRVQRLYRTAALRLIGSMLRKPSSYLLVETPDDLAALRAAQADPGARFAILGGPGVDPQALPALPLPNNEVPIAAYVGPLSAVKGVDVLMRAGDRLKERGVPIALELCEAAEAGHPNAIPDHLISAWCDRSGGRRPGRVDAAPDLWRRADICVLPARSRAGMPLALLQAAACARPLVVTDVPGCRHFVRNDVEGVVVPPGNDRALADALERLARDPDLRLRMGEAARLRLLHGFTEANVTHALRAAYASMLDSARGSS